MRSPILLALLLSLLGSCHSSQCSHVLTCQHGQIYPLFTGFAPGEIDTVTVYTFTAGSSFTDTLSTHTYTQPDSVRHFTPTGPAYYHNGFNSLSLQAGYDYIFHVRATGQVIRMSSISDTANRQIVVGCGDPAPCYRTFTGAVVTGSAVTVIDSAQPATYIGLQKE